ncbi:hypothetical protein HZA33_04810 [Candidatus Pacearchaeota archaeon]|nr:hypothetical protein [Candidatus Pacearchaeota archaeon]
MAVVVEPLKKKRDNEDYTCTYAMQELCDLKDYLPEDYQKFYCKKSETLCNHFVALNILEKLNGSEGLKKILFKCGCEK